MDDRKFFAGCALIGLMIGGDDLDFDSDKLAEKAFEMATAMMKAGGADTRAKFKKAFEGGGRRFEPRGDEEGGGGGDRRDFEAKRPKFEGSKRFEGGKRPYEGSKRSFDGNKRSFEGKERSYAGGSYGEGKRKPAGKKDAKRGGSGKKPAGKKTYR